MGYKTILVHVSAGARCFARVEMAVKLAKQFDAALVALHALFPFTPPGYVMIQMGPEVIAAQKKAAMAFMEETEKSLRKRTAALESTGIEWRHAISDPCDALCAQAKYADLVVVGQSVPEDPSGTPHDLPERLVLSAGRPVLIVPSIGSFPTLGQNILVAWNASREATRAVTEAIPLLKQAGKVHVMTVDPGHGAQHKDTGKEIADYLAHHGVKVTMHRSPGGEIDIGNELLSRAADLSADLIVMGGYGHSRLREWVLGGVTRTILESMTVPVLMSH